MKPYPIILQKSSFLQLLPSSPRPCFVLWVVGKQHGHSGVAVLVTIINCSSRPWGFLPGRCHASRRGSENCSWDEEVQLSPTGPTGTCFGPHAHLQPQAFLPLPCTLRANSIHGSWGSVSEGWLLHFAAEPHARTVREQLQCFREVGFPNSRKASNH